jgi:hypothetical protein
VDSSSKRRLTALPSVTDVLGNCQNAEDAT